jgi:RNA polymerase sigma-70 factor, ECF subfamily
VVEEADRRGEVELAYRQHADDVYRVAYALLHDEEAAADVTQETFARAYTRWADYDPARPLRPWLQTIAARLALDGLRRRRVRRLVLPRLASDLVAEDPSAQIGARAELAALLRRLEPRARAAVVLRDYYGYDYRTIAEFLRTSPGNVGALLSRAHAALRRDPTSSGAGPAAAGDRPAPDARPR